jgi:hypothetical protein
MRHFEFDIYFTHNPHSRNFLKYLDLFFAGTVKRLVVFYVGQGAGLRSAAEGGEALVFDDGEVPEDALVTHLIENKHSSNEIILVTDLCHSGTIWDIQSGKVNGRQLPPGIVSISCATDAKTAKQTQVGGIEQGIFTYNLTKTLREEPFASPSELYGKLRAVLKKYAQNFSIGASTPALLNKPLLA